MTNEMTNSQRLAEFFGRWDKDFETMVAAFREIFAEDAAWWNADSLPLVHGFDQALEKVLIPSRDTALGMECIQVVDLTMAEAGNSVFHERIDHIIRKDRSIAISIPIAGVTEFDENGKIVNWRDYCNPMGMLAIIAGDENAAVGSDRP
ncbi:limonene-1,2-epoxide hydrolase family protein [Arthrobacter sp. NPDC058127]|uniref:limonene-1,2-epoxide hydrolase family protein n=1 Tax=Arthrobacter sp. NPDC058127 TaxID=3346351 RepID=UPI0036E0C97B